MIRLTEQQKQIIKNGFIKDLDPLTLKLWLCFSALEPDVVVEDLVNLTGKSDRHVRRHLMNLSQLGWIEGKKEGRNTKWNLKGGLDNVECPPDLKYDDLRPVLQSGNTNNHEEEKHPLKTIKTAKDFITVFCELYHDHYGVNYTPNWGRDASMVKNKLMSQYTEEQLNIILTTTFKEFPRRWANNKYPRPSIGAIATFIANQSLAIHQEQEKKKVQIEEAQVDIEKFYNQEF